MRRYTFRDETHSALRDIERSVALIKRYNDAAALRSFRNAIRAIRAGIRAIRDCHVILSATKWRDGRDFRSKPSSKNPTVWEMRELIAAYQGTHAVHTLPDGRPATKYDTRYYGDFDINRNYVLHEGNNKYGKVVYTMPKQEMDRRFNEFFSNRNQVNSGSAGYAGSGANNKTNNGQMYGNIALPSDFYAPPEEKSRLLRALAFVNKAIKSTGEVIASLAGITAIGAAVANAKEIGGAVGSLKNWLVEKATNIKNMVSGNNQGNQRLRH